MSVEAPSNRLGGRLRDRIGRSGGGVARVRRGVFGGADVRPLRGRMRADQDADSTAVGWAKAFSAAAARQAALSACGSRGGSGCTVRVWGCNGSVIEEGLGLNQAARR